MFNNQSLQVWYNTQNLFSLHTTLYCMYIYILVAKAIFFWKKIVIIFWGDFINVKFYFLLVNYELGVWRSLNQDSSQLGVQILRSMKTPEIWVQRFLENLTLAEPSVFRCPL